MSAKDPQFRLKPPPAPKLIEKHVVDACVDYLRLRGYWPTRSQSALVKTVDGRFLRLGEPGIPDYTFTHGRHLGFLLEFKRPGGALTPIQEQKIAELRAGYGLRIAVISSVEGLIAWLEAHERSP